MNTQNRTRFPLGKNEIITLHHPAGWSIKSHTGRLWITQSNRVEDIFLDAGQVYVVQENGLLIIEAMNHALASLESPAPSNRTQFFTKTSDLIPKEYPGFLPSQTAIAEGDRLSLGV